MGKRGSTDALLDLCAKRALQATHLRAGAPRLAHVVACVRWVSRVRRRGLRWRALCCHKQAGCPQPCGFLYTKPRRWSSCSPPDAQPNRSPNVHDPSRRPVNRSLAYDPTPAMKSRVVRRALVGASTQRGKRRPMLKSAVGSGNSAKVRWRHRWSTRGAARAPRTSLRHLGAALRLLLHLLRPAQPSVRKQSGKR